MDRREFARELATGALSVRTAIVGQVPQVAHSDDPPAPLAADQLLSMLKTRYGDRLTDEQWKQIRGRIEGQLATAKTLGDFKLQNSDEPATVFSAFHAG